MQKAIGTRLGFTAFWKTDYFSKYFSNFTTFFLCYCLLIKRWLLRLDLLVVFINFREKFGNIHMVVGVYKYGLKYPRRRRFASREREKIKKYRWKRAERRLASSRYNREGLHPHVFLTSRKFSTEFSKKSNKLVLPKISNGFQKKLKFQPVDNLFFLQWGSQFLKNAIKRLVKARKRVVKSTISPRDVAVLSSTKSVVLPVFLNWGFIEQLQKRIKFKKYPDLVLFGKKIKSNFIRNKIYKILYLRFLCKILPYSGSSSQLFLKLRWLKKKNVELQNYQSFQSLLSLLQKKISTSGKSAYNWIRARFLSFTKIKNVRELRLKKKKKIKTGKAFLSFLQTKILKIKNRNRTTVLGRKFDVSLKFKRLIFLKKIPKSFGWTLNRIRTFLSFFLEQNFKPVNKLRFRFKFINVFKKSKWFSIKFMKFRKFILFRLYGRGKGVDKSRRKNRFFLNFFSLRGISLYLFKQMESQWGLRFRKFPQFADFINVVNMGLFFSRAEFLSETVAKNIVRNRRTWLPVLRQSGRILYFFFPIFCVRPVNYNVRIGVFGKLGGQRKRKFKSLFLTSGSSNPRQQFNIPLDYSFRAFWNYIGSFGIKVWIYKKNTL